MKTHIHIELFSTKPIITLVCVYTHANKYIKQLNQQQ